MKSFRCVIALERDTGASTSRDREGTKSSGWGTSSDVWRAGAPRSQGKPSQVRSSSSTSTLRAAPSPSQELPVNTFGCP